MHRKCTQEVPRGFTLIELLVVVAIIAILAAILFPVFAEAREKSRQTSCASNLRQLSMAVIEYTDDYDEVYPSDGFNNGWGGWPDETVSHFPNLILPYVHNKAVFRCPDDTNEPNGAAWVRAFSPQDVLPPFFNSYYYGLGWYDPNADPLGCQPNPPGGISQSAIAFPSSRVLLVCEASATHAGAGVMNWLYAQHPRTGPMGWLLAAADGHVKLVRLDQMNAVDACGATEPNEDWFSSQHLDLR